MDNGALRAAMNRNVPEVHTNRKNGKKNANSIKIVLSVIVVAVVVFVGLLIYKSSTSSVIDSSKYQAVFLSNGQVYFGKLKVVNGDYMSLTDIYYLQTSSTDKSVNQTTDSSKTDVELIKLGSEVHGPEDEMLINESQILFFENIKNEGNVTASILKYQESQKK